MQFHWLSWTVIEWLYAKNSPIFKDEAAMVVTSCQGQRDLESKMWHIKVRVVDGLDLFLKAFFLKKISLRK